MLSSNTIELVKSTVPLLEVHGETITKRFYQLLFQNHPELLDIFNHANQKQGRQQRALANAVYAAGAHIDHLQDILPVVKQISHKHRSLGIRPDHYPIVGENLLAAIKDVLGELATDEVIDAWKEAYGKIADVFIQVEGELYKNAGWEGFREFVVDRKVEESDVITSFYLKPKEGGTLPPYDPGQFISVKVKIPNEKHTQIRQYSLSDAPGNDYYRISVKREDAIGEKPRGMISTYLHTEVKERDLLHISAPSGIFTLDKELNIPVVLISGGVGVTPLMSMFNTLVKTKSNRQLTFIQAALNGRLHAFKEHVKSITKDHENIRSFVCYEKPTDEDRSQNGFDKEGYVDLPWLKSILPSNEADFYFCGPEPFMRAMYKALRSWGVPKERIHFEFFGPTGTLEGPEFTGPSEGNAKEQSPLLVP